MFNIISTMILLIDVIILMLSIIEEIYKRNDYSKKMEFINKCFNSRLKYIKKNISYDNEIIMNINDYEYSDIYENNALLISANKEEIYFTLRTACEFFSLIYNDKKIYSNIRIYQKEKFYTIIHMRGQKKILNERYYNINKNTDLYEIVKNHCSLFVISNIYDYKKSNTFILQNNELEDFCKSMISIALDDGKKIIGCFTIYFSKPLNDMVEIKALDNFIASLKIQLTDLVKQYIDINGYTYETTDNMFIENKNSNQLHS